MLVTLLAMLWLVTCAWYVPTETVVQSIGPSQTEVMHAVVWLVRGMSTFKSTAKRDLAATVLPWTWLLLLEDFAAQQRLPHSRANRINSNNIDSYQRALTASCCAEQ
jgi:hypothetical protein